MGKKSEPDVVVIGGGVLGLCSAYHCVKAGLQVKLVDAGAIAGRASGGIVGAMAPFTPDEWNPKKQFQFEALEAAEGFWADVDALSGLSSGYGRIGRLIPITSERELALAQARVSGAVELWHGKYEWSLASQHPMISPDAAPLGVIQEGCSARLYPKAACASLHQAIIKLGVEVIEDWPVEEVSGGVISGAKGQIRGRVVIVAAGLEGFQLMEKLVQKPCGGGMKGQAAWLDADLGKVPQIFADGIYIVPHEGGGVAVGSTSEKLWESETETDEKLDTVIATARRICPILKEAKVSQRWADVRPKAQRRTPMLGPVPDHEGVFAAMGGFMIGFGIAHKIGAIMAEYALGDAPTFPDSFSVEHHLR